MIALISAAAVFSTASVLECPLCSAKDTLPPTVSILFDRRQFRGQTVTNRMCRVCGLVYQSPRMSDEDLENFYEAEYRQLYQGDQGPNPKDLAVQRWRAQALVSFIRTNHPSIPSIQRHLDIGASAGLLLQQFQDEYHCQPIGVEPGKAYRTYAGQQGLSIYASLEELETSDEAPFDLVSMAHVLEHIPNPVSYLTHLRQQWIAPGGLLLVEVPNLYGHDCFEVAHLVSYSPHTLSQTLQQAGFQVQKLQTHGLPRSQVIPLYITALAQPVTAAVSSPSQTASASPHPPVAPSRPMPERGVRVKRQFAMLRRRLVTRLMPRKAWMPVRCSGGLCPPLPSK